MAVPLIPDNPGGTPTASSNELGYPSPPPPPPTAVPTLGAAPTVSNTPGPGQGVALQANGQLPQSVKQSTTGYEYDRVTITGNATVSGTGAGAQTTIITGSTVTYDGQTAIWVEFYSSQVATSTTSGDFVAINLFDGTTSVCQLAFVQTVAAASLSIPVHARIKIVPTAGPHAFIVQAFRSSANGLIVAGTGTAGSAAPAYLLVTRA